MPTPPTSNLPKPKSWEEFEDIVWEIYTRMWQDSHTQRYGRSGQAQYGVDIYGQPYNSSNYVAIQCKLCENTWLSPHKIEEELLKVEGFSSPISEYIIATTQLRDTKLQDFIRSINEERKTLNKFAVQVIFWEDICSYLTNHSNYDLLRKYYSEWITVFQNTTNNINKRRKQWRKLNILNFPVLSDSEASRSLFAHYLIQGLKNAFEDIGYTEFISLICQLDLESTQPFCLYQIISHKAKFCSIVKSLYQDYQDIIKEIANIKSVGFSKNEEIQLKEDMEKRLMKKIYLDGWTINANLYFSENPIPHKFIFDSDTKSISIYGITKTIWHNEPSTSDLMMTLACMINYNSAIMEGFENLYKIPKLMRLYTDYFNKNQINYEDFIINVEDDEEWDYFTLEF